MLDQRGQGVEQEAALLVNGCRVPRYDVRLRREIAHRRLVVSMARRVVRVLSLHVLDGALTLGIVVLLASMWPAFAVADRFAPVIGAIFLLSLNAFSSFDPGDGRRDRKRLSSGIALGLAILACLSVFPPHLPLTPTFLVALGVASFTALALGRYGVDLVMRQAYAHGIGLRRALLIGGCDETGEALLQLRGKRNVDQYVVGHVAPDHVSDPTALGTLADLPRVLDEYDVQEVIVATELAPEVTRSLAERCFESGTAVFVVPAVMDNSEWRTEPEKVGGCPLVRLHPARLQFPGLLAKRAFDILLALLALVAAAPLMALIAVAIRLDSPGPVLYHARRVGLGGRAFRMWKFRSMYVDAEQREAELAHLNIYAGGTFKLRDDPRVTRVGKLLRRSSLDELPQLFNVLLGNMSLVGPRPALPGDIARYQPHHFERLGVVPGITGPWQVNGRNLITDFEAIVEMERGYISEWSFWVDLKIMLRTVGVVLRGEGAY